MFSQIVCVGSIEELQKLTGKADIKDLHRERYQIYPPVISH